MGRWEPDARGRLQRAALELFTETSFERTTVADIAARAGVTERTFFRHFADKREVLFSGSAALHRIVVDTIAAAPPGRAPIDTVVAGFEAAAVSFPGEHRDYSRQRGATIAANPGLQERESLKMVTLAAAAADALRARGVSDPAATLAAETGVTVFKVAFETWLGDGPADFAQCIRETYALLLTQTYDSHTAR